MKLFLFRVFQAEMRDIVKLREQDMEIARSDMHDPATRAVAAVSIANHMKEHNILREKLGILRFQLESYRTDHSAKI